MLVLEFHGSPHSHEEDVCRAYWEQPPRPSRKHPWRHSVKELAQRFTLTPHAIRKIVEGSCAVYDPAKTCDRCSAPRRFRNRDNFDQYSRSTGGICVPRCHVK
jgi:hypothetical protein